MSVGKAVGEFSFTSTGVTVSSNPGEGWTQQVNLEGTATGFGAVIGTLTFHASGPGAENGYVTWAGSSYMDDGEAGGGLGRGVYEKSGANQWRIRALIQITDGPLLLSEGEVALEGRTYVGTIYQWE
jgi:hypothetical protein